MAVGWYFKVLLERATGGRYGVRYGVPLWVDLLGELRMLAIRHLVRLFWHLKLGESRQHRISLG